MVRKQGLAALALLAVLAACAGTPDTARTPPEDAATAGPLTPAPEPPAPARDHLVELGDAEAAGDTETARAIAADYLSVPDRGDAETRLDVADYLAGHGDPAPAFAEYEARAAALAQADPVDHASLTDLMARMADLALLMEDEGLAAHYVGEAAGLVRTHLGHGHPRLAPLLDFALANGLEAAVIGELSGIEGTEEGIRAALEESLERSAESERVVPSAARGLFGVDEPDFDLVKVFYGTNRAKDTRRRRRTASDRVPDPLTHYGGDRAPLETGTVMVSVPRNRAVGDIPKPKLLRFEFRPDPARHVIMSGMKIHSGMDEFVSEMKLELARSGRHEAFVFIHGYNVTFPAAVERTAQLSVDLEIDGASVLYSWPSFGTVFSYKGDRAQIVEPTIDDLQAFLTTIATETGAERVHVVAHSMGNEFLVRALVKMAEVPPAEPLLDEVVFASPDVDADEFMSLVGRLGPLADDMTLYASSRDRALQASRRFNNSGRRAGESDEPVLMAGLNTIDTTQGSSGGLGHGDIFDSAFTDFQAILWLSLEPEKRCLLGEKTVQNAIAWVFGTPREAFCGEQEFATAITTLRRAGPERTEEILAEKARRASETGDPSASLWSSALRIIETMR